MRPDDLIAGYVADVAEQLPIRMRSDVALELRSLLQEDLEARAEAAGRTPDEAMTLEMLRAFGHPSRVAERYHPEWSIIDPGDTRSFVLAGVIGGALLAGATSSPTGSTTTRPSGPRACRGSSPCGRAKARCSPSPRFAAPGRPSCTGSTWLRASPSWPC